MRLPLFVCCCVLALGSCAAPDREPNRPPEVPTIRFAYCWAHGFNDTIAERRKQVADSYDLVAEPSNGIQHRTKILLDVSSNNLPDVFTFWSYETNLGFFVDNDLILDAQEIFDASKTLRRDAFLKEALAATELRGRNYALPYEMFYGLYIVNKRMLDDLGLPLPRRMRDLETMAPALRRRGIVPLTMGSYLGDPGHLLFSALTYQTRGGYRDTVAMKRTGNFLYPANSVAAAAALRLSASGVIPENTIQAGSWDYEVNQFNQRKAASIYTFNWTLALFDPEVARESVVLPLPLIDGAEAGADTFTVGGISQSICVNKASWKDPKKRAHILEFLEWLFSDEVCVARVLQEGSLPTRPISLPAFENPIYGKALAYLRGVEGTYGLHEFFFPSVSAFDRYKEANDLLWSGAVTAQDFLEQVQEGMGDGN